MSVVAVLLVAAGCASDPAGCTTFVRADGAVVITCGDSPPAVVEQGARGTDGGSCTVAEDAGGAKTITCEDGTSVTIRDGDDGDPGGACTVEQSEPGRAEITCDDGTTAVLRDGRAGDPGADGHSLVVDAGPVLTSLCPAGGVRIRAGVDDGGEGGVADDGVLHSSEVDRDITLWGQQCPILEIARQVSTEDTWSWGLFPAADLSADEVVCTGRTPKADGDADESRAWLRLDASVIPAQWQSAHLELWAVDADVPNGASSLITVHAITESWSAAAVDFANEPAFEPTAAGASSALDPDDLGWVGFDVSGLVAGWLVNPAGNHGVSLQLPGLAYGCFASSAAAPALQPRLVFTGASNASRQQ